MQAHLFTTSTRDVTEDLDHLQKNVSSEIIITENLNKAPENQVRQIAIIDDLSDEAELELLECLDQLGIEDITLLTTSSDDIPVVDVTDDISLPVTFFVADEEEFKLSLQAAKPFDDLLKNIFDAKSSGIDYPEKTWGGDLKRAYDEFVRRLGKEPCIDKGSYMSENDIARAAHNRPPDIPDEIWSNVELHLSREIKLFHIADKWFGISGYLHGLFSEQQVFNQDFLKQMNDKYLHIDEKESVTVVLDGAMQIAIKGISLIKGYGSYVGSVVSALWNETKKSLPDNKGEIKDLIANMENQVADVFKESLLALSKGHTALANDWGLLDAFGESLKESQLEWPTDLSSIRRAQSKGFQYIALQSTVHLLSGRKDISYLSIGIIDKTLAIGKKQDGHWIKPNGYIHYQTHSKEAGKWPFKDWYCRELYLGYQVASPKTPLLPQEANINLQNKLFGKDVSDPSDPQFGLTAGFLLSGGDKTRKGWNLKNYPF